MARRKVHVVEDAAGIAIAGDGEVLFNQCEMVLAKGSSQAVVAYLYDGD